MRSLDSEAQMEEERRLCYVGMTRAEKRLFLSWARFRRRFGGGQPEPSIPSRFLKEVPRTLVEFSGGGGRQVPQVELYAERSYVRETAKRNLYTGKTYNSVENISNFFAERGMPFHRGCSVRRQRRRPSLRPHKRCKSRWRDRRSQPRVRRRKLSAQARWCGIRNMAAEPCFAVKAKATTRN